MRKFVRSVSPTSQPIPIYLNKKIATLLYLGYRRFIIVDQISVSTASLINHGDRMRGHQNYQQLIQKI